MFEEAGLIYVYLVYGIHYCLNFVTMKKGFPAAVLIRSIIIDGENIRGPGRVCKRLGIDKGLYGEDLIKSKRVWVEDGIKIKKSDVISSKRIGVDYAGECANWEWNHRIKT
jgi:DNA-3-methyladenine glycosylase